MRYSWKQHAAAATVSLCVVAAYAIVVVQHKYSRERGEAIRREIRNYDRHTNGRGFGLLVFSSTVAALFEVVLAIVPYELTLMALNSKRLSGED